MNEKLTEISRELNRLSGYEDFPHLIFITNQNAQPYPERLIDDMPEGSMVIFRDYDHESRNHLGEALRYICKSKNIKFLVGKDLTLALSLEADGIHLPEFMIDEAVKIADEYPDYFISASVHNEQALEKASDAKIDAVLMGPIFATKSHPDTFSNSSLTVGLEKLSKICAKTNMPIYPLGGINSSNAESLLGSGAAGIAAIRGI